VVKSSHHHINNRNFSLFSFQKTALIFTPFCVVCANVIIPEQTDPPIPEQIDPPIPEQTDPLIPEQIDPPIPEQIDPPNLEEK